MTMMVSMMTSFIEIEDALLWRSGMWVHSKVRVWSLTVREPLEAIVELSNLAFAVLSSLLSSLFSLLLPLSFVPPPLASPICYLSRDGPKRGN